MTVRTRQQRARQRGQEQSGAMKDCVSATMQSESAGGAQMDRSPGSPGFRALFEDNPVPLFICSPHTQRVLRANAAATRSYGWDEAQFRRWTLDDLRAGPDALAGCGIPVSPHGTCRHRDARGVIRCVEMATSPLEFDGHPALLVAVWDVTDRIRAEHALREAHRLARIATWRAVYGPDRKPVRIDCTPDLVAMLGVDGVEGGLSPDTLGAHMDVEDRDRLATAVGRALSAGTPFETDAAFIRPDGGIVHLRIGGQPAAAPGGHAIIDGYCQDVSEGRAAQKALRLADKLSAMGQLTGGVAHDFNNLLTVVSTNLELAMAGMPDGDTRRMLAEAAAAAERGAALTAQLLAFARRQSLRPAVIGLGTFLDGFAAMVRRTLGDRHPVLVMPVAPGLGVTCDEGQFETALLNLVLNARDAMPDGGPITIEAVALPSEVAVRVRDRGVGMAPEVRDRVLEPFFTTKPPGQGTGLGLSMALGFARQSGGDLTVDSAPGQGSTLSLILPRAEMAETVTDESGPQPTNPALPTMNVLLVEDDPSVRAVAASIFERFGMRVEGAATAEEALDKLDAGLACDLVFTDIVLGPGLDGFELGRRVRSARPGIAVLFTSGYNERAADAALSPEIADCELLPKPYAIEPLRAAVGRALLRASPRFAKTV